MKANWTSKQRSRTKETCCGGWGGGRVGKVLTGLAWDLSSTTFTVLKSHNGRQEPETPRVGVGAQSLLASYPSKLLSSFTQRLCLKT